MNRTKIVGEDHFAHYKCLCGLKGLGQKLVYTKYAVDIEANSYPSQLEIVNEKEEVLTLSGCGQPDWYDWYDDKTLILSAADDQGNTAISLYHLERGVREEILNLNKSISFAKKIKEGKWLLLCSDNLRWDTMTEEEIREEENYFICEEVPFWSDSSGYTDRIRNRLYLLQDGELTRITAEYMDVGEIKVYEDQYAVFFGQEFTDLKLTTSFLYYLDIETMEYHKKEEKPYVYTDIVGTTKNHIYAIRSDREKHGEYQNSYIDEIDIRTGQYKRINDDCHHHLCNSVLSDIVYYAACQSFVPWKNGMLFIETVEEEARISWGDFDTGKIEEISTGFNILEFSLTQDEKTLYFTALDGLGGPELWKMTLEDKSVKKLTGNNDWMEEVFHVSRPEPQRVTADDGTEIHGYIMKPFGFTEGKKYPVVLEIHGGPETAYGSCYYHQLQMWAAEGYGVIYCNPRGSIGRGADFSDLRGKYYTVDYDDIMIFVERTVEDNQWMDTDRLAVMGGSYGGMMTNWIIGHTDRFKTAISDRCAVNEFLDFFTSDIGLSFQIDVHGKLPWDEGGIEELWERAPIRYAPNIKTPTLFVHGEKDYRCTKEQSLQMFAALKYFNVPSKVFIVKDEGHGLCWYGKPKARIRRLQEMKAWLKTYL